MTDNTKQYVIRPVAQSALYGIFLEGGGEVPNGLKGRYTSPTIAHNAIMVYNEQSGSTRTAKDTGEKATKKVEAKEVKKVKKTTEKKIEKKKTETKDTKKKSPKVIKKVKSKTTKKEAPKTASKK